MLAPDSSRPLDDVGGIKVEPDLAVDVGVAFEGVFGHGHPSQDVTQNALLLAEESEAKGGCIHACTNDSYRQVSIK